MNAYEQAEQDFYQIKAYSTSPTRHRLTSADVLKPSTDEPDFPPVGHPDGCSCTPEQTCPICKDRKIAAGQGAKYDTGKLRYDLITPQSLAGLASILGMGAEKYGPNNWQQISDGESRYTAAMMRHFEAYRAGDTADEDSNQSHVYHCMCNLMFLIHFESNREG